jgi:hypothetical protein
MRKLRTRIALKVAPWLTEPRMVYSGTTYYGPTSITWSGRPQPPTGNWTVWT